VTFWYDKPSNMLIYPNLPMQTQDFALKYADAIQVTRPNSHSFGDIAVEATLENMQKLRLLKLPVLPPVTDENYDWPIRAPYYPREHQRIMTNFMVLHPRSFNLSDMGTMKTLASLWAADFIMKRNPGQKALIVCPLSIMRRVWADALFTHFMGRRKCKIVHGTSDARIRALDENVDFYIINHDGICVGIEYDTKNRIIIKEHTVPYAIKNRPDINIVIVDEASAFRNGASRRSRVARAIFTDKPYLWPLTGTPTSNGPLDAHGLAKLVNGAFGEPYTSYKKRVMVQVTNFKWAPKPGAHIEAHKLLQPSIRFQMRDCTDVPPCTEETRDVALSAEQKEKYNELKRELVLDLGQDKKLTVAHEAALRLKLIQISCGALYDHEHATHFIDCKPRIAELKAVLDEAPTKTIVFAPLTSVVNMLYAKGLEWSKDNDRFSCECITGEVKPRDRDDIFRCFQREGDAPNILYADPGTMSHGLDLFAASVVVWYGPTDRTEIYLQANRRIDRPGQRTHTTIVRLASTPVEREIYRRLSANQNMQGLILGLAKEGDGNDQN
jgi:SNF2 family DNA or RNA helicase